MTKLTTQPVVALLLMVGSSLCFVVSGIAVKFVADSVDNYTIVFARNFVSTLLLLPFVYPELSKIDFIKPNKLHIGRAIFSSLGVYFYFLAISLIPLSEAVLLQFTSPLFIPFFALIFMGIAIKSRALVAACVGFLGVAIVLNVDQLAFSFGSIAGILSGIFSAFAILTIWRLVSGETPIKIVFMYSLFGTILMLPYALISFDPINLTQAFLLVVVGLFSLLAQLLYTVALTKHDPDLVISASYTGVIWATVVGVTFFSEAVSFSFFLGATLIVVSCIIASRNQKRVAAS